MESGLKGYKEIAPSSHVLKSWMCETFGNSYIDLVFKDKLYQFDRFVDYGNMGGDMYISMQAFDTLKEAMQHISEGGISWEKE